MVYGFADFKFGVGFEVFPNCGFGVVARAPGAIGEHFLWEVFDDGVEDDAVTRLAYQRSIGAEFFEDMRVCVIAVQTHEDFGVVRGNFVDLLDDFGRDARALDHLDARGQRMGFDRLPVVRADIDVKAEDFSFRDTWINGLIFFDRHAEVEQGEH